MVAIRFMEDNVLGAWEEERGGGQGQYIWATER